MLRQLFNTQRGLQLFFTAQHHADLAIFAHRGDDADAARTEIDDQRHTPRIELIRIKRIKNHQQAELTRHILNQGIL